MKVLCTSIYAALSLAIVTAVNLGPLESLVHIGDVDTELQLHSDEEIRAANDIIGLLEYARRLMPVGLDMFLDVMEPYSKDRLISMHLDPADGLLDGTVDLLNLVASGAQQFTIHDIGVTVDSNRLEFNVSVPTVEVEVTYEIVNMNLANILVFNSTGISEIVLTNLRVEGMLAVEEVVMFGVPHYVVVGMEVMNSVDDVEVHVHGKRTEELVKDTGYTGRFQQSTVELIRRGLRSAVDFLWLTVNVDGVIPDVIVEQVKDSLMTSVAKTAMLELSGILQHFSVEQVMAFLEL